MKRRILGVFTPILISIMILSGCRVGDSDVYVSAGGVSFNAFMMGTMKCPQNEANMYVACFSDYFGHIGGIEIERDHDSDYDAWVKQCALALLSRVYSLNIYAQDSGIELSNEEKEICARAASDYYRILGSQAAGRIGASEEDIAQMYEHYFLAFKVYEFITMQADSEVSEDEARVMDGYVIHLSDPERVSELEARLAAKDSFATLVQVYSDGDKRQISFGRDTFPQPVTEAAFRLENGEITGRIETDEGIYFVNCINKYNEELSIANKQTIIEGRQRDLIKSIQKEQDEKYYSELNTEFFDEMSLEKLEIAPASGKGFFGTIESYMD